MGDQQGLAVQDNGLIRSVEDDENATATGNSPNELIARAIERDLPVETMERLLAMRRELKEEQAREAYYRDLSRFQSACPEIEKTKRVYSKSGDLRYTYAPLDEIVHQVRELLQEFGFAYSISTEQTPEAVTATCAIHHRDGHSQQTSFSVPIDEEAYMNAQQKVASALTYAKRYAFINGFGILTTEKDDDAESLSFDDGVAYAEYITALSAITDAEELKNKAREYHQTLKGSGDHDGAAVIHRYYTMRRSKLGAQNG
jgi:hypothetical protein